MKKLLVFSLITASLLSFNALAQGQNGDGTGSVNCCSKCGEELIGGQCVKTRAKTKDISRSSNPKANGRGGKTKRGNRS